MSFVGFSEICTWTGGAGDAKWSSAANWMTAGGEAVTPQNGDQLIIPAETAPVVVSNDLAGIALSGIWLQGTKPVTIAGAGYVLTGNTATWPSKSEKCAFFSPYNSIVSNLTEIVLDGNATLFTSNAVFTGRISASEKVAEFRLESYGDYLHKCKASFYGDIDAPNADLNSKGGGVHNFYGRLRVKDIWYPKPASNTWLLYLYAADNEINRIQIGRWGGIYASTANAYPTNLVFRWNFNYAENDGAGYQFSYDQTIDHIEGDFPIMTVSGVPKVLDKCIVKGPNSWEKPCDLTLRGTTNATSYARLAGFFDLIWDPVGDFAHEFRDRISAFTGTIRVNRGTFISGGTNVFTNVKAIEVAAGAAFDIASTNATLRAFPNLQEIKLAPGAKLYLTNGVVNAFPNMTVLTVDYGAKVVLGAEAVQPVFAKVVACGVGLTAGTYSDVPWLEGGSISVSGAEAGRTYWKAPVSGDWSDATKWTQGVPSAENAAFVTAQGAGEYTVTNDAIGSQDCAWTIGTAGFGTSVVSVGGKITNASKGIEVLDGGRLDVPTGGVYEMKGQVKERKVGAGGEWRVSGGLLSLTNSASRYFTFTGEAAKTATVSVTSGKLLVSCDTQYPLKIAEYGLVKTSGDGQIETVSEANWGTQYISPVGGRLEIGGSGGFNVKTGVRMYGLSFDSGKTTFSGNAVLQPQDTSNLRFYLSDTIGTGTEVTFRDQSLFPYMNDGTVCVGRGAGRVVLNFVSERIHGSSATVTDVTKMKIGHRWNIGCDGGYGELNVSAGYLPTTGGRGVLFGGTMSTTTNSIKSSVGCTGVCHVAGGCFAIGGSRSKGWYDNCMPGGLLLGYGALTANTSGDRVYRGYMDVTGGAVTNRDSDTVVGAGFGYGEWRQLGGETYLRAAGVKAGVVGGEGLIVVSGGTFFNKGDVHIGGAGTNAFGEAGGYFVERSNWPIHRHDAIGTLVISGGVFTVGSTSGKLYVGVDGQGTIEMAGAAGTLTTPYLVLSNTLVEAGTAYETQTRATLRFVSDATGAVSPITVTQKATVTPGTKLELDLSACPNNFKGRLRLINGTTEGMFTADDMVITGPEYLVSRAILRQSTSGVSLSLGSGLCINFR